MRPQRASDSEVEAALAQLPGWFRDGDEIVADFRFGNFVEAFAFMTHMASVSEELNHHPEWSNVYSAVSVRLTTHDAGGLTRYDFDWAAKASAYSEPESTAG